MGIPFCFHASAQYRSLFTYRKRPSVFRTAEDVMALLLKDVVSVAGVRKLVTDRRINSAERLLARGLFWVRRVTPLSLRSLYRILGERTPSTIDGVDFSSGFLLLVRALNKSHLYIGVRRLGKRFTERILRNLHPSRAAPEWSNG